MVDFLLLHGMNVGGWEWDRVRSALEANPRVGRVVAPDMPGRGASRPADLGRIRLQDYVEATVGALREADLRDAVVVGHSGGGIYLQAAVAAEPARVRRMVFLCAAIPRRGESMLAWQPLPLRALSRLWLWLARAGRRRIVPSRRLARRGLCPTLQPDDCEQLLASLVPEPQARLIDALDWDPVPLRGLPATYIQTTPDRVIRPKDQLRMARTVAGVEVVPLPAGHAVLFRHEPNPTARLPHPMIGKLFRRIHEPATGNNWRYLGDILGQNL
jgi:pimeloyl-ACP methyl ester carboxylesterase